MLDITGDTSKTLEREKEKWKRKNIREKKQQ